MTLLLPGLRVCLGSVGILWKQTLVNTTYYDWLIIRPLCTNLSGDRQYKLLSKVNGASHKCPYLFQHNRHLWNKLTGKGADYYEKDGISKDYIIVYQGPAKGYIEAARIAVLTCPVAMTLLGVSYFLDMPLTLDALKPFIVNVGEACVMLGMYIVFSVAVGTVVNRFVLRAYYKESSGEFVVVLPGWGFQTNRLISFKAGEASLVVERDILNIALLRGRIRVRNQRLVILEESFQTPFYYNLMLGYDKHYNEDEEKSDSNDMKKTK